MMAVNWQRKYSVVTIQSLHVRSLGLVKVAVLLGKGVVPFGTTAEYYQ